MNDQKLFFPDLSLLLGNISSENIQYISNDETEGIVVTFPDTYLKVSYELGEGEQRFSTHSRLTNAPSMSYVASSASHSYTIPLPNDHIVNIKITQKTFSNMFEQASPTVEDIVNNLYVMQVTETDYSMLTNKANESINWLRKELYGFNPRSGRQEIHTRKSFAFPQVEAEFNMIGTKVSATLLLAMPSAKLSITHQELHEVITWYFETRSLSPQYIDKLGQMLTAAKQAQ